MCVFAKIVTNAANLACFIVAGVVFATAYQTPDADPRK